MAEQRHWPIVKPLQDAYATAQRRVRLTFKIDDAANAAEYLAVMSDHRIFVIEDTTRARLAEVRRTGDWHNNRVVEVVLGTCCNWGVIGTVAGGLATYIESVEVVRNSG